MRRLLLTAALALPLAGCFYPASRGKALEQRLDKMDAEKAELAAAVEAQRKRLEQEVAEKVAQVEKTIDALEKTAHRTGADTGLQLEQMQQDVSVLRGQVEQYLYRIAQCEAQLAALKEAAANAPAAAEAPKPIERPADKKAFAELVATKLESDPKLGRTLAEEWLRKWPKDSLAARVHYQLGNSFAAEKDHRAAIAEYGVIFKEFPKSDVVPDGLLKSAESFAALKKRDEAKLALEEIINSYPKSPAAKAAKAKLSELKKQKK